MTGGVFSKARKVAEGVDKKRREKEARDEQRRIEAETKAQTEKRLTDRASAAVMKIDEKLNKAFNEFAGKLHESGFKEFDYRRHDSASNVAGEGGRNERGQSVYYAFYAPSVEPLEFNLFVRKTDDPETVSCGIVNQQAAKDEKWPVIVTEGTETIWTEYKSADPDWNGTPIDIGSKRVKLDCVAEVVFTPAVSGPIKKALSEWFESVAAHNQKFSRLLANGDIDVKSPHIDLPRAKAEKSQLPSWNVINKETIWGTEKYNR